MGLGEPITWGCWKCHSFTLGMGLNNTSQQTALTFRTPMLGYCNFHHHGGQIRTLGTGGAYEGGPRTASVAKCATGDGRRFKLGWRGISMATKEHREPNRKNQRNSTYDLWRRSISIMFSLLICNPQEEKERARHVTWNAWWQHFDVLTSSFPCKSHNSRERNVEPTRIDLGTALTELVHRSNVG